MPIERKLAAIMFTDIAGYTESMSKSESKSLDTLEKKRSILKPLLKEYKGTFVKEIGDGTLSYFESAVNAATCAVKLQETTYDDKDMNIRVGIHIGDIVFKDGDVFGGGVNVASRLESIAPAGGVCVSKSVFDELSNQDDFDGIELGLQSLKGVGRLIEVFGLKGEKLNEPKPSEYQENKVAVHSDDEVPSIAIIPFRNKGKEEDIFYAYGISADLITDCSGAGLIRVESLDRIEKIENYDKLDITELATKLLVRYVATGSLWKMGEMFQLSVELYDTKDKKVVWSDRWQENWDNLPTIKMHLSDGLLKALDTKPKVEQKVDTTNPEAYEFYLKAKHKYEKRENMEDTNMTRGLLNKAIELDNNLLVAKRLLGITYKSEGDFERARCIYEDALLQSEKLNYKRDTSALLASLGTLYHNLGESNKSLSYLNRALAIRKELGLNEAAEAMKVSMGLVYWDLGNYDQAIDLMESAHNYFTELGDIDFMDLTNNLGGLYNGKGLFQKAFDNYKISLKIRQDKGEVEGIAYPLMGLGLLSFQKKDFNNALKYLQEAYDICKNINLQGWGELIGVSVLLALTKKKLKLSYNDIDLKTLLNKPNTIIGTIDNYNLYQLLEDSIYLETAYNQVQEKADNLETDVAAKFLSYPIPKAIVEEWKKVK